jgi:hypothetical protein
VGGSLHFVDGSDVTDPQYASNDNIKVKGIKPFKQTYKKTMRKGKANKKPWEKT